MLPLGQRLHLKSCLLARVRFPPSCSLESRALHSLAPLEVFCPYPLSLTVQRICRSVTLSNGAPAPVSKLQTHTPPPPQSSTLPFSSSPPPGIRMVRRKTYLFFSLLYFWVSVHSIHLTPLPNFFSLEVCSRELTYFIFVTPSELCTCQLLYSNCPVPIAQWAKILIGTQRNGLGGY